MINIAYTQDILDQGAPINAQLAELAPEILLLHDAEHEIDVNSDIWNVENIDF
jgi:hypothetical protein